ncbi:arginine--tRNA ligase [Leucothrix pacifica]|uniref:Arginine--tRNA ligase n=1 Tax=Leucothrix pacifica TaxID=1247513 RepID=A0A317C7G2_9GAMM|nr:arginine--tRNA ligase [Leucothrix pacifica]PWQ92250.1 arginine--tRNA ligase [Leucothrix pacifica]
MNIRQLLETRVEQAMETAGAAKGSPAVIKPSGRPEFGDYQANGIMGAAKKLKMNPRQLATSVLEHLDLDGIAATVEIAGPGFINIHLSDEWLSTQAEHTLKDKSLNIESSTPSQTIVIDYSGPNLAKEMHVGHLRSTIIGDVVTRTLKFLGHNVIPQNHVGDWGTQFGMLLAHMKSLMDNMDSNDELSMQLADLESFYRDAKNRFDNEEGFADIARDYVVKLQSGDAECYALWQQFVEVSLSHCDAVYERLGVLLTRDDLMPESAYNDDLPQVVEDLKQAGLITENDGAQCVFLEEFKGRDDTLLPAIVQKSDGGYLYATSDLAALRYRHNTLHADRMLYFVDARQSTHLAQVYAISKKAGFVPESTSLEHMAFGTMMGQNGKPFATRTGGTVKLVDLLEEAEQRAFDLVSEKNPDLGEAARREIAKLVGVGAVKYADLSKNRTSDYIFNWETMLSFEGNTAPYLQYAHARIRSIFAKAGDVDTSADIAIKAPSEHQLALTLMRFSEALEIVEKDGTPNTLCNYLFELAGNFMTFYEACPILKDDVPVEDRSSRLQLAQLTANTLKTGLGLLGIEAPERM